MDRAVVVHRDARRPMIGNRKKSHITGDGVERTAWTASPASPTTTPKSPHPTRRPSGAGALIFAAWRRDDSDRNYSDQHGL